MMQIIIKDLMSIRLDLISLDEHLPSFNVEMKVVFFGLNTNYQVIFKSLWYTNDAWDKFTKEFYNLSEKSFYINDLSSELLIGFEITSNGMWFVFKIDRAIMNTKVDFDYRCQIDLDDFNIFKNAMASFEKWW